MVEVEEVVVVLFLKRMHLTELVALVEQVAMMEKMVMMQRIALGEDSEEMVVIILKVAERVPFRVD